MPNYTGKVLVSACLLGQPVRYDGKAKLYSHPLLNRLAQQQRIIEFCPECAGGLPIPRDPAERQPDGRVITVNHQDVSEAFIHGAEKALAICKQQQIKYALLKANSPSCGNEAIYNGQFTRQLIAGQGITAELLSAHQISVFNEHQLSLLEQQLHLIL